MLLANRQLVTLQRRLDPVGKEDAIGVLIVGRGLSDYANSSARAEHLPGGIEDLDARDDLRADRNNQTRVGSGAFSHSLLLEEMGKGAMNRYNCPPEQISLAQGWALVLVSCGDALKILL